MGVNLHTGQTWLTLNPHCLQSAPTDTCAIWVAIAPIFNKTVPSMPNKVCRFVFLFVLCVPLNFVFNYVNVWAFGYHKMSWTAAIIIALLLATYSMMVITPNASGK